MFHRRLRVLSVIFLLLFGCAPSLPAAPAEVQSEFVPARVEPPAGVEDDPPAPFALLPGDAVVFRTLSVRPLEAGAVVDPAGRLHVPLAGAVEVGGYTLPEAEAALERALEPYDRHARVTLVVSEPRGHRATVAGAVEDPGAFVLEGDVRISGLLALAGGPRTGAEEVELVELADLDGARLVRDGVALPISVSLAATGHVRHDVRVRPGDLLYVPAARGRQVIVLGDVERPRTVPFRAGLRLSEALARAGGPNDDADEADVRVIRGPLSGPAVYRASLAGLVRGDATDVELAPGDVVYVTTEWLASVGEVLQRLSPLLGVATLAGLTR
jgi:polysaccharide export outer membrane protein